MADKEELITQFVSVTGADNSRAKFFLESAAWNVELAISSFFEGGEPDEVEMPSQRGSAQDVSMPSDSGTSSNLPPTQGQGSRFGTIGGLNVVADSDSSEEEGQAYYAGGSDRSGQQVLGPPKKKDTNKLVDSLFKSAKEHGAEEKQEEHQGRASHSAFIGSGYRLGETSDDSTMVAGAHSRQASGKPMDKKLKLWKNGFSVDNGALRDYNDPTNAQFLDSISKGEVPQELVQEARGGEVNLDMEDHRAQDFVKPKASVRAFTGAGHMLGSPVPTMAVNQPVSGDKAPPTIQVDESSPTTSVQLRLADGKRLVLKLNHSHKVSDIRAHIVASNPQYTESSFCLMTTFPNKELTNEDETLKDANLLNAVIMQRMK